MTVSTEKSSNWLRRFALPALTLALAGCLSMTPQAENVRVVRNANEVKDCRSLGNVEATSGWGSFATAGGFANNKTQMRNETADRGGDALLIHTERGGGFLSHSMGEAFRCQR